MSKIINLSFQRNATQSISQIFFNMNIPGIHHKENIGYLRK